MAIKRVLAVMSGGMDSTALFFHLRSEGYEVIPVNFSYGSKHNEREREAFRAIMETDLSADMVGGIVKPYYIDIDLSFLTKSSLINDDIAVPHGHYAAENMRSTVVPFRNGVMLAYAAALAEELDCQAVAIGNHWGDHTIYPDCRGEFINAMGTAIKTGTYSGLRLLAPFTSSTKADVLAMGVAAGGLDAIATSYSCYEGSDVHCGKCGTCQERKEAFFVAGIADPTVYKDTEESTAGSATGEL